MNENSNNKHSMETVGLTLEIFLNEVISTFNTINTLACFLQVLFWEAV